MIFFVLNNLLIFMNKTYLQDQKNKVHRKIRKKLEKKRKL